MKKYFLLFILTFNIMSAQSITLVSEKSGKPLSKVIVFGKGGSILAHSDNDGKIEKQALDPPQEKYDLVYDNMAVGSFSYSDLTKDVVKVNDKVQEIEPVIIKSKPAKYLVIKGYFNSYVTLNNRLNAYADGIVTYIIDNEKQKIKKTVVQQYRVYGIKNIQEDLKDISTWDGGRVKIPEFIFKGSKREFSPGEKDVIEFIPEPVFDKEFNFLGYTIFNDRDSYTYTYEKNSKQLFKKLLQYNYVHTFQMKHKKEDTFNNVAKLSNFYPTEISFSNSKDISGVKYERTNSNYISKYWENSTFPNMQVIFSKYMKDDLVERKNIR